MADIKRNILVEGYNPSKVVEDEVDRASQAIYAALQNRMILQAPVVGVEEIAGHPTLILQYDHIRGIIPGELSGVTLDEEDKNIQKKKLLHLIGQDVAFRVVRFDRENELFVGDRKSAIEMMASIALSRIEKDDIIIAVAKEVTPYVVRADVGGIMVEIPISEIDYGWIDNLRERVRPGDHLKVKVLEIDKESGKIVVSAKAAKPGPWPEAAKRYQVGSEYAGRVSGVREFGIFVNLEPGVDVFCKHMRFGLPRKDDRVIVRINSVEPKKERISGRIVQVI